jgi:hypothetical protein
MSRSWPDEPSWFDHPKWTRRAAFAAAYLLSAAISIGIIGLIVYTIVGVVT